VKNYGRQSAVVLVFDHEGRVLVLRRSASDPWKPHHWNFPGGGVDATDETVTHGAVRELYEEAGIPLPPESLNWAFSFRDPGLVNVFWVKLPRRPSVHSNDGEHDTYAWVHPRQIPQPSLHSVRYIVEQITGAPWNLAPRM
jgi:8-oxo-dGTP pyrophosphatase MutT (NUDIX family)